MTDSPENMAGQKLMVGFDGTDFSSDLEHLIATVGVGGVILFSRNVRDPEQIGRLCGMIQQCAEGCGQPPLFIAVDQEGGEVSRLKEPFTDFAGNDHITTESAAAGFGRTIAYELSSVGINMDMAPVLDVAFDPQASIMTRRSFGADPAQVGRMGREVIRHLQAGGVMAVGKHFPGIGRTVLDSHEVRPALDLPLEALQDDLLPFRMAVETGVAGIMLSHILYAGLDPQWPASLSPAIVALLRTDLGFNGVIFTDDMDMGAIRNHDGIDTAVCQIMAADVDVTLICHRSPDMERARDIMRRCMEADEKVRRAAAASVERILALKRHYLA
ncbi:MAG: beta-N-acetylhexosaminidase [Pseudomonadota bacterium]